MQPRIKPVVLLVNPFTYNNQNPLGFSLFFSVTFIK